MFVEVKDRAGTSFLVNTDQIRSVTWEAINGAATVNGMLTGANGDRIPIQLDATDKATLWESLRALTGATLKHDAIG
jgi:hypothetical protein